MFFNHFVKWKPPPPYEHRSQQFVNFNSLLRAGNRLDKVIHIEVSPYQSGNIWRLLCVIPCNLLQSITCASWRIFGSEDMSSILIQLNGFICIVSLYKSQHFTLSSRTFTSRNIASLSAVIAIFCYLNLKIISIRFCSRSGPVKKLSFKELPRNLEAALHTRLTFPFVEFLCLFGFSTGWCGTYHCLSKFVASISSCSRILTNPFSTSNLMVSW